MTDLQFDKAEPAGPAPAAACTVCGRPIADAYFEANGRVVCRTCRDQVLAAWNRGTPAGRFARAALWGVGGAIVGAGIYYAILAATGYEIGLVAIVVGFLVGGGVRRGANGRGGWPYQALAIFLTYTAIVSTYVPFIIKAAREEMSQVATTTDTLGTPSTRSDSQIPAIRADSLATPAQAQAVADTSVAVSQPLSPGLAVVALLAFVVFVYAVPFLAGVENIIGLLIIGFALFEAWKMNQAVKLEITGPYRIGGAAPTPAS